jgi:hypothetical protein
VLPQLDTGHGGAALKLEIDNQDCTQWVDAEHRPRVVRKLNRPSEMTCALVGENLLVPALNARVAWRRESGEALFTGYVTAMPEREYLGWGQSGSVYRYTIQAIGDEALLDREVLKQRPPFVMKTAGEIVREMTEVAAPGEFEISEIVDGGAVTQYGSGLRKWSDCARAVAESTRMAYSVHDSRVRLRPIGEVAITLDEQDEKFSPERLQLRSPGQTVDALTVLGKTELDAYVKDYFLGDGYDMRFNLSDIPYGRSTSTVFEQEYTAELDPAWWKASGAASVNSGRLWMQGTGSVEFAEQVELRGSLAFQHGEVQFQSASDGVIGGLYDGPLLVTGFRISKTGAESQVQAVINGATAGQAITTQAGHRYLLSTRVYATEIVRANESFHSSESVEGGGTRSADARIVLEVHDVDPNSPASLVTAATVLYDGSVAEVPAFSRYGLLEGNDLRCSLAYTRMLRMPNVVVRSALPSQGYRTRLVGAMTDGAECRIYNSELTFFSLNVPASNERIVAEYRVGRRSMASVGDEMEIGEGVVVDSPSARTAEDCANAGVAILQDRSQQAWAGEYQTWSDFLPNDVWPGDAACIKTPSRGCEEAKAIVREVELQAVDPANERSWYTIKFANEAANPIAIQTTPATAGELASALAQDRSRMILPGLPQAEITNVASTAVTIDAGVEPMAGGGFEVRRTDSGWDPLVDRNLIGRFQTRSVTVPRLSRVQTYCIRQYDDAGNYSSCSTQLHVDYPL